MKPSDRLPPGSRYAALPTAIFVDERGQETVYLRRRFCPPPERLSEAGRHVVISGDRLDVIAGRIIGDAEHWWQICDGNRAMDPDRLVQEPGRVLRITLPDTVPNRPAEEAE